MAIQLEDLVARLRLDTSGVSTGLGGLNGSLSKVGSQATNAGKKLSLGLTTPIVGIGIAATNLAAGFDKTMRQVAIATGGPSEALEKLAMTMGAETAFSAGEAADAMLELAKGGMTAAQIQGGALAATMKLASAGGIDLASASTYVSNSMAAFGLAAKDADSVTVALAGAANASSASVESLGLGLSQAAASARNAGLSLQETTGVLSLFDSMGLKGSDAGTSLKSMLNSLIPTTEAAAGAMADANLDFVDAQGNFVGVANMAEQLKQGLGGLTEAQRASALETIFGSDGMRAASALMRGGAEEVRKFTQASRDQKTTTELANAAMEGTSGAMERAKGSIETAALVIGQVLAPYVEKAAGFVERLANAFTNLPGPVQGMIVGAAALAAALGPLLVAIGFIATGLSSVVGLFAASAPAATAAGAAASASVAPFLIVAGAIAAVGVGFALLYRHSESFRTIVQAGVAQVAAAFAGLRATVAPIVSQIVGVFRSQLPQIRETVASVFGSVKSIVQSAMSILTSVIRIATSVIRTVWATFGDTILSTISRVMSALQQVIRGAFAVIQGIFRTVAAVLKGDWSGAWDGIKQIASGALDVLGGLIRGGFAIIRGIFSGLRAGLTALMRAAWEGIKGAVSSGIEAVMGLVKSLPEKIKGVFSGALTLLSSIGSDIVQGLVNGIQAAAGRVAAAAASLVDKIPGPIRKLMGIASPSKVMFEIGQQIAAGLELGMRESVPKITAATDAVASVVGKLSETIKARLDKAYDDKKLEKHLSRVQAGLKDERAAVGRAAGAYDTLVNRYNEIRVAGSAAYDAIIVRLDEAKTKLAALAQQQADYAAQIAGGVVDTGNVVNLGERKDAEGNAIVATAGTIIEDLQAKVARAGEFASQIATLTAMGLNQSSLQQLLAAGVENGLAAAQAITTGGAAAIAQINVLTGQLATTGAALGASTAATFYGEGVRAAQAVANGIAAEAWQSQQNTAALLAGVALEIDAAEDKLNRKMRKLGKAAQEGLLDGLTGGDGLSETAKRLAKRIEREVKDALGIRSPSKVFRKIGEQTGAGLAVGMDSTRRAVAAASARMADAATMGAPTTADPSVASLAAYRAARGVASSSAPGAPNVRVFIGDRELTDIVDVQIGDTLSPLRTMSRQGAI